MSWKLRLVDGDSINADRQVSDCFYIPDSQIKTGKDGRRYWYGYMLSDEYERERRKVRPPIAVVMPYGHGSLFCIDSAVTGETRGWQVTGDAPNITVSPSINIGGLYHGWIQGGVLSDDCEGRKFP